MYNYICHQLYVKSKKAERIGDKVEFLPHHTKNPFMSSDNHASLAAVELPEALLHPNP